MGEDISGKYLFLEGPGLSPSDQRILNIFCPLLLTGLSEAKAVEKIRTEKNKKNNSFILWLGKTQNNSFYSHAPY